ncbi:S-methyl-5-thioribose-1-phosphate isomerase [bacterium]|nr:S-methyl-5-thioribose-1-phosphate isomerase [bacterium]
MIEAIVINNKQVKIIDQTLLPQEEKYFEIKDYQQMIEAIKKLRIRGAPAIGIAGLVASALACDEFQNYPQDFSKLEKALTEIENARPTAVNLSYAVNIARKYVSSKLFLSETDVLWKKALELAKQEKEASNLMAEHGVEEIFQGQSELRILTHCNTGSLATYGEGTALAVIKALSRIIKVTVWVDETRPLLQGARLTMWELIKEGIECYLISDSMAAHTIKTKQIDLIITGADRITRNGDSANKIGTLVLSILANYYNIPFYIVAPTSTIDYNLEEGSQINIEERDSTELKYIKGVQIAPSSSKVFNPAFDVVDNQLITAIISEKGVHKAPYDFKL